MNKNNSIPQSGELWKVKTDYKLPAVPRTANFCIENTDADAQKRYTQIHAGCHVLVVSCEYSPWPNLQPEGITRKALAVRLIVNEKVCYEEGINPAWWFDFFEKAVP